MVILKSDSVGAEKWAAGRVDTVDNVVGPGWVRIVLKDGQKKMGVSVLLASRRPRCSIRKRLNVGGEAANRVL